MKKHELLNSKHAGFLLPIFSMTSDKDFGCGDISSMSEWLDVAHKMGFDVIEILPINEMPPKTNCPYTSLTAFAIDPVYLCIEDVENLSQEIVKKIENKDFKALIKELKKKDHIDYDEIKRIKFSLMWEQYLHFLKLCEKNPDLKKNFDDYKWFNSYWLNDYAFFRRMKDVKGWISWTDWETEYKNRDTKALSDFEKENYKEIDYFKYIQWEIEKQWKKMRTKAQKLGIRLFGDLPFMVNQESADVWGRQYDFRIDLEAGAPPDAFSETGQKWGLPCYNWDSLRKNDFEWWRLKVKKAQEFYDIFRIDHMVGFFRTWIIPKDTSLKPQFDIINEKDQENRGRDFIKALLRGSSMLPIAEDLGVIPDYVYEVLNELNICGYKVLRWERKKNNEYIQPENFHQISLATTSTHDNEPMALWWDEAAKEDKKLFWHMISETDSQAPHTYKGARDALLKKIMKANSCFIILPIQDIIASKERVNAPNTVGTHNWSYRIKENAAKFEEKHEETLRLLKTLSGKRK